MDNCAKAIYSITEGQQSRMLCPPPELALRVLYRFEQLVVWPEGSKKYDKERPIKDLKQSTRTFESERREKCEKSPILKATESKIKLLHKNVEALVQTCFVLHAPDCRIGRIRRW